MRPLPLLVGAGAVLLSACGATESADPPTTVPPATAAAATDGSHTDEAPADEALADAAPITTAPPIESSPRQIGASGLDMFWSKSVPDGVPEPLVDLDAIRSGGPPPDGIPPIDDPRYLPVDEIDFLADNEPVLAFELDGDARAYPVQIMTWHEIVNDTVGGVPVSVSYCPLCNSAVAYDRRVGDLVLDFGTSGLLWNSALVMYDRQTETLWSHFTGEGIVGELTGEELSTFPLATVSWSTWRDANPDGLVLSRETGFNRDYGRNPYPGYDDIDGTPFLFEGQVDGRYTAMSRFVGIERGGEALGVPLGELREVRVAEGAVGGETVVVWWAPGTASALDDSAVAGGYDVGATGVFVPTVDDRRLTFFPIDDDAFTDAETGSTWNVLGRAIDGELTGAQLAAVAHVDTFWFAWAAFRPDTAILSPG